MTVRVPAGDDTFAVGLAQIREQFDVRQEFPPEVLAAAQAAAARTPGADHVDRTSTPFVTLDPASSTDLDQAFAIERHGDVVVLHYAIADVGFFVEPDGPLDREAWTRGVTVYLPDQKASLYPSALSEGAASLLPGGPRPSVVFTVEIAADGAATLARVERAMIESRQKLAYDSVRPEQLPGDFAELSSRIAAAELARDAPRVDFPEQEVEHGPDGWQLVLRPRLDSEEQNAGMSLATNLAVADALQAARTGLFRVMSEPTEQQIARLRNVARAFGLTWPAETNLLEFQRTLGAGDPRAAAFLIAVRRASGGASYEAFADDHRPWHAAMAATYAHATAPLRRLADRYVVEATLAVANGRAVPDPVQRAFAELPKVMERAETVSNRVDNAVLDLAEAVLLSGREGETFDAVVIDEDQRGALVQLTDPAVLARVSARRIDPGDDVRVRVEQVDVVARRVELQRVG